MTREEKIKRLSTWLHASIDDFYKFAEGNMSLKTLCNKLAEDVVEFDEQFKEVKP